MAVTNFGVVQLGRLQLREALTPTADAMSSAGVRTLQITGQEAYPAVTVAQMAQLEDDLLSLVGSLVPVMFTNKQDRNGYYQVTDASASLTNWTGEFIVADWKCTLLRVGTDSEVDIESRLSGATARNNSFSATGERWHAPPIGHYGYWTGPTQANVLTRTGADGAMTVYRGLPVSVNPRWGCPVGSYMNGRVRFLDSQGAERSGINYTVPPSGWELSNGLVKVTMPGGGSTFQVAAYAGGAWRGKNWDVQSGGANVEPFDSVTVLRNEPELVVIRLLKSTTIGRRTVDLTLRRGSRFVELYVQRADSGTLGVKLDTPEAGTASSGYIAATVDDSAGNRYIVGSAKTFTADAANGGISVSASTTMDAFIGAVVAGDAMNPNSGFESGLTGWSATGGATLAVDTGTVKFGTQSVKITPNGTTSTPRVEASSAGRVPVSQGSNYLVTGYINATTAVTGGHSVTVNWMDAAGAYLSTASSSATVLSAGVWTQLGTQVTPPAGAAFAAPRAHANGTPAASDVFFVDELKIRPVIPPGDTAPDMYAGYLGAPAEYVQGVRR